MKKLSILLLSFLFLCAGVEIILRAKGHKPWQIEELNGEPVVHAFDPELGWDNKPGNHSIPKATDPDNAIAFTITDEGTRASGPSPHIADKSLYIVGGSYAQGWEISDDETFAWQMQQRNPAWKIRNFGVGGFSTYQALLMMERLFREKETPTAITYSFSFEHIHRNEDPVRWLSILNRYSKRGQLSMPYAVLGKNGSLVRLPPLSFPALPFRENLATVKYIEDKYVSLTARKPSNPWGELTKKILLEMRDLARRNNTRFFVMMVGEFADHRSKYIDFLNENHFDYADCAFSFTNEYVADLDHPNGKMNGLWAQCMETAFAPIPGGIPVATKPAKPRG